MIYNNANDVRNLIRELNSRDKVTRGYAAKKISSLAKKRIFDVNSIEPLTKLLQDESNPVRYNAAFAIGDLAQYCRVYERNTASKILTFLYDKDEIIRWSGTFAIRALAKRGVFEVASVKPLIDLLNDRNDKVQYNAAFALGDIAEYGVFDKNEVSPLIRLLTHNHERVRWSAAFALKTLAKKGIFNTDFLQSFAGLLLDSNERVRYNAAYAIGYLAEFGAFDKSTIYPLIGLLSDRNGVRGSAAFALGCLAKRDVLDVAAIKPLKNLLSDYNEIVRKNAAEALKIFQEKNIGRNNGYRKPVTDSIPVHPESVEINGHYYESINDDTTILVNIKSSKGFKVGLWEKLDVKIQNMSEDIFKDIKIELFGPVETNGNKIIYILNGNGSQIDIVIGLKPKEPGDVPIRFEVVFSNQKGKLFKLKKEAFISVAKENETISMGQLPVINIGHIDKSTNINGSVIQRSNIGAGEGTCSNCKKVVGTSEKSAMSAERN
jgi:HEAT repeat protein